MQRRGVGWREVVVVGLLASLSTLPFLGQRRHLSSREGRHAEIAREMVVRDAWVVPTLLFEEYRDKPPVLHDAAAVLFRLAGRPSYGLARLPSAIAAVLTALCCLGLARLWLSPRQALFAALGVVGVQGIARMARVARPDMILAFAVVASAWALARAGLARGRARAWGWMAVGGLFAGLGVLTKGPYGVLFPVLFALLAPVRTPRLRRPPGASWLVFVLAMCVAVAVWAVPAWLHDDGGYLRRVVLQPNLTTGSSHHARPVWYYAGPVLVALLPLTVLLPVVVWDVRRRGLGPGLLPGLVMLAILSLVPGKRAHYLLPALPFVVLGFARAVPWLWHVRDWGRRASWAVVAVGLMGPVAYYGAIDPLISPALDPEIEFAQRILARVPESDWIVSYGQTGDVVAFVGERNRVRSAQRLPEVVEWARRDGAAVWVIAPEGRREEVVPQLEGWRPVATDVAARLGRRGEPYRLYRLVGDVD